jgi:2-polyprenyl-6-methoxyphenol hydroxylase-like FAD-dependent oxidoreductase
MQALDLVPSLAERVHGGKRSERFVGTGDLPFFFRKPYGPGWALVGDAGYHKDPLTAQGSADAFRDAELLAEAVDAGLSGGRPLEAALADYERQRNEAALPLYEFTYQLAGLQPPPPEMQQLFGALRHNQEQTDRFFGIIAGTTPLHEFFGPENLGRIMGAEAQGVTV